MKLGLTEGQYKKLLTLLQEQAEAPAAEPEAGTSAKQSGGQGYPAVGKWESGVTRGPANQVGVTKWADVVGAKLTRGHSNQLKEQTETKTDSGPENVKAMKGVPQPTPPIPAKEKYPDRCQYYAYGSCPYELENQAGEPYFWYYHSESPTQTWLYCDDLHGVSTSLINPRVDYKLGNYSTNDFVGTKLVMQDYYETEFNWWLQANMNTTLAEWRRYHNRISKNGVQVPKGFNPDDYDEYLAKIAPLEKEISNIRSELLKPEFNPVKIYRKIKATWNGAFTDGVQRIRNLEAQIESIKKKYCNEEFSYGITFEELEHYYEKVDMINQEYGKRVDVIKEKYKSYDLDRADDTRTYAQTAYAELPPEDNALKQQRDREIQPIEKEWSERLDQIDMVFGKDNWIKDVGIFGQSFDRFWDKWGTALSIVGNIAIIAASGGIAGIVQGTAGAIGFTIESGILRAAAPYAADFLFNSVIATYEASRGKNEAALISFICAMVPFMSWEKNIGKVSIESAESLSKKVSTAKYETKEEMEIFVKNLTPEERRAFRDVMTLPKESIIQNYDLAIKKLSKEMTKTGVEVAKSGIGIWMPALIKQLGIEGGVPVSAGIINGFFKLIKDNYGHFYTEDELVKVKQYLDGLKLEEREKLLDKAARAADNLDKVGITKENTPDLIAIIAPTFQKDFDSTPQIPDSLLKTLPQNYKKNVKLIVKNSKTTPLPTGKSTTPLPTGKSTTPLPTGKSTTQNK